MKNKEEIIHNMCMTYRHDYGLRKSDNDPPWLAGMTENDAKMLYKTMEQIYNNDIEPFLKELHDLREGNLTQVPKSKEHALLMLKLAHMYLGEDSYEVTKD
jgi:hypothetical protein